MSRRAVVSYDVRATDAEKVRALKEGLEQVALELCELTDFGTVERALEDAGSAVEWEVQG